MAELPETIRFDMDKLSPGDRKRYFDATGIEMDDAWEQMKGAFEQIGEGEVARIADLPDDLFVPLIWIMVRQSDPDFTLEDAWEVPYRQWQNVEITSGNERIRQPELVGASQSTRYAEPKATRRPLYQRQG